MSEALPIYFDTHPMAKVAEYYGLDWDKDILAETGGDLHIDYETNRRWRIKGVVISIYRLATGRYELTHYKDA